MPELPEVEVAARRLRAHVLERRVRAVRALHPRAARALPPEAAERVVGRRVVAVERHGKHQWLVLDDGARLHVQFRMNGDWWFGAADAADPPHARLRLALDDGGDVALVDSRALATVSLQPPGGEVAGRLGPDAVGDPRFDAAWLRAALRGRTQAIKPALMDQRVVAGIGNIYAAEALWRARIDPRTRAGALGPRRLARLVAAVADTLAAALTEPGRQQDGEALGRLHVYERAGAPCPRCAGPVRRIVQSGRSTYFCPRCQRS